MFSRRKKKKTQTDFGQKGNLKPGGWEGAIQMGRAPHLQQRYNALLNAFQT